MWYDRTFCIDCNAEEARRARAAAALAASAVAATSTSDADMTSQRVS